MKAYNLYAVGKLSYEEVEIPKLESGWALLKVKASGICSSDVPRILKKGTYNFPTIPGHEFSGVVETVADEKDKEWIGKYVVAFPLIPCKKCEQCKSHHYEMCENYDYVGSRRDGAFAEYVAVPVWNLLEIREGVSFQEAAMLEPLSVALHAVKQAGSVNGKTVAVVGSGMIGFALAKWAMGRGASSAVVIGNSDKTLIANKLGLDYKRNKELDKEAVYDVVFEAVGTPDAINLAIGHTKVAGHIVLMGNPSGNIELSQNTYWKILRKQMTCIGTWNSYYESGKECDWSEAMSALADKEIDARPLITHVFDKDHLADGLEIMVKGNEPYCKVMVSWE